MPALFSLGIQSALEASSVELGAESPIFAYLDDVYVITNKTNAETALRVVASNIEVKAGIRTHLGKLQVWGQQCGPPPVGIPQEKWLNHADLPLDQRGVKVLGAPIGTDEYVRSFCQRRVQEQEKPLLDKLATLTDPQVAWLLVRFCAEPRFNHLLRNVPPRLVSEGAAEHDTSLRLFMCGLLRVVESSTLEYPQSEILAQPGRHGGCGLRLATRTSLAAYWAGWAAALPLLYRRFNNLQHPYASMGRNRKSTPCNRCIPRSGLCSASGRCEFAFMGRIVPGH